MTLNPKISNSSTEPVVSIIVPCRNEEGYIEDCVHSIMQQKNVPSFELLVVDGNSTDSTKHKLSILQKKYNNLKVINNVKQTTPYALNLGIENALGMYICIFGAHSNYDDNYLANGLDVFNSNPELSCVGGPIISLGENNFAQATAIAMSSSIGVGNAKHRFPNYEGYAEMACFPIFKREVFSQVGLYDEYFTRNQDDEFCYRLNKSGGKIYLSPKLKSYYYVRKNFKSLFNQYFDYGFWRVAFVKKHKVPISLRQLIPFLFFLTIFVFLIFSVFTKVYLIGLVLPLFYLIVLTISGLIVGLRNGFIVGAFFPIVVLTIHFAYAIGFLIGIMRLNLSKKNEKAT